jgi:hypothetical protein
MSVATLISSIDAEIAKLHQARALLAGAATPATKKRGRPAKTAGAAEVVKTVTAKAAKKKRRLSLEARARMAEAARARWAKAKKAAKK